MLLGTHADRRRTTRVRRQLIVHDRTGPGRLARRAIDLCQDGIRLIVPRTYVRGTQVELDLFLGDRAEPLRVRGEVVGPHGEGAGIAFVGLRTADRVRLVEYLFGD